MITILYFSHALNCTDHTLGNVTRIARHILQFSHSYRASWYYQRFYTNWCTGFLKGVLNQSGSEQCSRHTLVRTW